MSAPRSMRAQRARDRCTAATHATRRGNLAGSAGIDQSQCVRGLQRLELPGIDLPRRMPMKAILAHVTGGDADEGVLEAALTVARMFDSHVEALHTRLDPSESGFFLGGDALAASVPVLMEAIERDAEHTSALQSLMRISYAVF